MKTTITKEEKRIIWTVCNEYMVDLAELKEMGFTTAQIKSAIAKSKGVLEYGKSEKHKGDRHNMGQFGRTCGSGGTQLYIPAHVFVSNGKREIARKIANLAKK